ncbi:MAG TPA: acetate--CoA ligase family protein [Burkholderiales bacterium]|nr:acetate--CoA ligase family protein [Burkholderiales bacterium]
MTRLFAPASVALVGATAKPGARSTRVFDCILDFGYPGTVYPVNPALASVRGIACHASLRALPEVPDHVGIIVGADEALEALAECAALGVPFATVYSPGFAETAGDAGRARQAKLLEIARASGMRVMGPNCNGVISFVDGFAMTATGGLAGPRRPAGNVGIVSQSGGLGQINVMWRAQEAGVDVSYQASCGNEADLDALDFVRFMLRSEQTDVVLLAVESLRDGAKLAAVADEALAREKPIVVLKYGWTEPGSRAAASHTGAIAGQNEIWDAAFRQLGLIRVADCDELYETALLLRTRRWPRGRRAASVSATGGNVVHVADVGSNFGLEWPEYGAATQHALAGLTGEVETVGNPSDMNALARGEPERFNRALEAIAADPDVDMIAPGFVSVARRNLELGARFVLECDKPAAMLWVGGCLDEPAFGARDLIGRGVPVYRDAIPCLRAMRAAADFGAHLARRRRRGAATRPDGIDASKAAGVIAAAGRTLGEREAKAVLAAYGFRTTREHLAVTAEDAVRYARALERPVALKIDSPDVPHKTDAGGVRLGVSGDEAVRRGHAEVLAAVRRTHPEARLRGVLVQEMAPEGVEMILGIVRDEALGPVVAVGLGGIHVEVLRDVAYGIPPLTHEDAHGLLRALRGYPLLQGVRGAPPRDVEAVAGLLVRLSWLACDLRQEILEVDVNPLVVQEHGAGACVVDALMVLDKDTKR